jgi:hypothetical protein
VGASKRQVASSKKLELEAAQWQAAAQAQGGGGTGYWYIGTCIDAYKFGMRRYNVPFRPHIVRRSTYVGPNGPTDRSVSGGPDRPTDQPIKKLTSIYNPTKDATQTKSSFDLPLFAS